MRPSQNRRPPASQRGFTLIELMIVVAIIGALASVAFPSFATAALRARKAERAVVLTSLVRATENLLMRNGRYPSEGDFAASWNPPLPVTTTRRSFDGSAAGWKELDVAIEGTLYYSYFILGKQPDTVSMTLEATALGDLDGDGTSQSRTVDYVLRDGALVLVGDTYDPAQDAAF